MNELLELSTSEQFNFKTIIKPDGKALKYFKCIVPPGLEIRDHEHGKGLHACKDFKAGDCISINRYEIVDDNDDEYCLITQYGEFQFINKNYTHFIKTENKKKLSTFDTFMNHSCDPNVYFVEIDEFIYRMIALKDIKAEEELTCNYSSFCYELIVDVIEECLCYSPNCQKTIRGFKHLPLCEQINMLPLVDTSVKNCFYQANPYLKADHVLWGCSGENIEKTNSLNGHIIIVDYKLDHSLTDKAYSNEDKTIVFYQINSNQEVIHRTLKRVVPEGLHLKPNQYGIGLFASKNFKKGDVIYKGRFEIISHNIENFNYALHTDQGEFVVNNTHSVRISDRERLFFTFDSFMNHSCDPNYCDQEDTKDSNKYTAIALKDIAIGDEITCNYNLFDFECDGHKIERCLCGASNCKQRKVGFKYLDLNEQKQILNQASPHLLHYTQK